MASLKDLRMRINSVKNTRKITQAMKMVAAAKLRRAQTQAEAARPYAERTEAILASLSAAVAATPGAPPMLVGTLMGTPITGSVVKAAAMPGRCAAPPPPAIITRKPRLRADSAYSTSRCGVRCGDTKVSS